MKEKVLLIVLVFNTFCFSQKSDKILEEGQFLRLLEKASWHGTDDFLERFKTKVDSLGGYLSYENEEKEIVTIFYSRFDSNQVFARYVFNGTPNANNFEVKSINQKANNKEKDLIAIRQDAILQIQNDSENFFTFYENTSFNPIPIINNKVRKVYLLTAPKYNDFLLLGNDYELIYDKKNRLKNKLKIHNTLLKFPLKSEKDKAKTEATIHTNMVSDKITPTTICTLLVYKDYLDWDQHIVMNEKFVSIFNFKEERLFVIKRKAWERMQENIKKLNQERLDCDL